MTQSQIKNRFFLIVPCSLFCIELGMFSLLESHILYPILCFFIISINVYPSTRLLLIPIFFMSLLSYLDYNIFGWSLIYILPIMLLAQYLQKQIHVKIIIPYILLVSGLLLKINILSYNLNLTTSWRYKTCIIVYNILMLSIFHILYYYYFEEK